MRKMIKAAELWFFQQWLMDRHERGHSVEWLLYHGYATFSNLYSMVRAR